MDFILGNFREHKITVHTCTFSYLNLQNNKCITISMNEHINVSKGTKWKRTKIDFILYTWIDTYYKSQ